VSTPARIACLAVVAVSGAVAGLAAVAQPLTFHVSGEIRPGVCRFDTSPPVDLGTYPAKAFTGDTTTDWRPVSIIATGCDALVRTLRVSFSGTPDIADGSLFRALPGIGIEIVDDGDRRLGPAGETVDFPVQAQTPAVYALRARFHQSAPTVGTGVVNTAVTFNVQYL
jgi:type 1 fimbria pilin